MTTCFVALNKSDHNCKRKIYSSVYNALYWVHEKEIVGKVYMTPAQRAKRIITATKNHHPTKLTALQDTLIAIALGIMFVAACFWGGGLL